MLNKVIKIHISFDDVILVFENLASHNYQSIFQQRFLKRLKWFHDKYGCKFTLYVFIEFAGNTLRDISDRYKDEILQNADWLKLGYHGYSPEMPENKFIEGYMQFRKFINKNENMEAYIIRLHKFYASSDEVAFLSQQGIQTLLTADDERCSYDLSDIENRIVNTKGEYERNTTLMRYKKTDLRLEDRNWKTKFRKILKQKCDIVVFSHERFVSASFFSKELFRLRKIIRQLSKNNIVEFYN